MQSTDLIYHHENTALHGKIYLPAATHQPKPAVIIVHDWSGRNAFAEQKAAHMAAQGYVGIAIDMYGNGAQGATTEEKQQLMQPLVSDRQLLLGRMQAALQAVSELEQVASGQIAALGFCFGGLCALDLARSGAMLCAAVSVHGLLNPPLSATHKISAKILALQGNDDPMVPVAALNAFADEMTKAQADWQLHLYGNTQHAFTNPQANDPKLGIIYNPRAEQRAWISINNFLQETFS